MATRTGRLFQDQNLIAHVKGAGNVTGKADHAGQKKGRAGGRKPLGDLSNAGKPVNQVVAKKALDVSGKPSVTTGKASEKSHTRSRKALTDISNAGNKPLVPEIKNKNSLKPSSLIEESLHPCAIAEERMLHDHRKCIQSQFEAMNMHQFLKTVGLQDDSDDEMTVSFELPAIGKLKSENSYLDLEEVPELLPEVHFPPAQYSSPAQHGSPVHCMTPKLSSYFDVNLKLIESP